MNPNKVLTVSILIVATLLLQGCAHQGRTEPTAEYIGESKNGIPHGQGSYIWVNGDKYIGEWKEGKRHGQGTLTRANRRKFVGGYGGRFVGEWKEDKKWNGIEYDEGQNVVAAFTDGKWSNKKSRTAPTSKSKSKTSCNTWQCVSLKCMQHQLLLQLAGGNTDGWMTKCMALRGYSWLSSDSTSTCSGPYCQESSAWDYLPGSRQWRCRDTGGVRGGEFVPSSECSSQQKVDNWP